jgi:hypothetical protein
VGSRHHHGEESHAQDESMEDLGMKVDEGLAPHRIGCANIMDLVTRSTMRLCSVLAVVTMVLLHVVSAASG